MSPTARKARLDAMHEQWDSSAHAFRCHYTNVVLNHNEGSAWHAEWEHVTPDDDSTLVIAAGVVNRMKANLTVEQFRDMIAALNAYFFEGRVPFNEFAFPLNWQPKRLLSTEVRGPSGSPLAV